MPKKQKQALTKPLVWYEQTHEGRDERMADACVSGRYMLGVSYATVSRAVKRVEGDKRT